MEELRSELREYLTSLRQSLIELINSEYESFIGLSLGLRQASVSTSLSTIRRPVLAIRQAVIGVRKELEGMKKEMSEVLEERKGVREVKAVLKRLLEVEDAVERVEGLLGLGPGGGEVDRIQDSPSKKLERIAAEYSQMLYLVEKAGKKLPFVASLDYRIQKTTTTLLLDLSTLLTSTLLSPSSPTRTDALQTLFQTYASLSLHSIAENIFRTTIVKPFIISLVNRDSLNSTLSQRGDPPLLEEEEGGGGLKVGRVVLENPTIGINTKPLINLYNKILEFVERDCGVVIEVTRDVVGYEIVGRVVWEEVGGRLGGELGGLIFAAGRAGVFHQNYLVTRHFLSRLTLLSPTLPTTPLYKSFLSKFQLPVYFQMRFREIVSNTEKVLEGPTSSIGGEKFIGVEAEVCFTSLKGVWGEGVWLEELGGRFWKVSLQLISRYRTWQSVVVPKYLLNTTSSSSSLTPSGGGVGISAAALATLSPASVNSSRSSFDGARWTPSSTSSSRPQTPAFEESQHSEETTLKMLTVLIADARLFETSVLELWDERIRERIGGGEEIKVRCEEVLRASLSQITLIVPLISTQIITILTRRCAEHLKHVRAVASQVRASTRKQNPNEPSFFVPNILKELRGYMTGTGRVVEEELRIKWSETVVEEIAGRYASIVSSQKRTEDSLRWFKKGRQGTLSFFGRGNSVQSPDDGSTEDDKVKMQMQLDIDQLGKEALTVGVDVGKMGAWEALRNATEDQGKEEK